jgi:type I restriction-modification system DNA methylase subunit
LKITECDLQAVISLPSGVFKPYAGVATAALIFQKHRSHGTNSSYVWFYDLTADGFSLDDVLKVENEILRRGSALLKQLGDQP